MNCQEFDAIVLDLVRGNLKATAARRDGMAHASNCRGCAERLSQERVLSAGLQAWAESSGREPGAGAARSRAARCLPGSGAAACRPQRHGEPSGKVEARRSRHPDTPGSDSGIPREWQSPRPFTIRRPENSLPALSGLRHRSSLNPSAGLSRRLRNPDRQLRRNARSPGLPARVWRRIGLRKSPQASFLYRMEAV